MKPKRTIMHVLLVALTVLLLCAALINGCHDYNTAEHTHDSGYVPTYDPAATQPIEPTSWE